MLTYLYLDYGGHARYRQELKYSLISLKAEAGGSQIVIYTDSPATYRLWPVTTVPIAGKLKAWSGGGLYYHRIKPEVVRDALTRFAGPVCLLDSDSIIRPGFAAELAAKITDTVVMNSLNAKIPIRRFRVSVANCHASAITITMCAKA